MKTAVDYAHLIGKYIRMERPATTEEKSFYDTATVGMEATVWYVYDQAKPGSVGIVSDEGLEFVVHDGERWMFMIWPDESQRKRPRI